MCALGFATCFPFKLSLDSHLTTINPWCFLFCLQAFSGSLSSWWWPTKEEAKEGHWWHEPSGYWWWWPNWLWLRGRGKGDGEQEESSTKAIGGVLAHSITLWGWGWQLWWWGRRVRWWGVGIQPKTGGIPIDVSSLPARRKKWDEDHFQSYHCWRSLTLILTINIPPKSMIKWGKSSSHVKNFVYNSPSSTCAYRIIRM